MKPADRPTFEKIKYFLNMLVLPQSKQAHVCVIQPLDKGDKMNSSCLSRSAKSGFTNWKSLL